VTDGIFHQRLNEQARYGSVLHIRRNLGLDLQLVSKSNFLDGDVVVEKRHLFRQWNFLPVFRFQREAEKIAQMLDHPARKLGVPFQLR